MSVSGRMLYNSNLTGPSMSDLLELPLREILGGAGAPPAARSDAEPSGPSMHGADAVVRSGTSAPDLVMEIKGAAVAMVVREVVALLERLPVARIAEALRERHPETAVTWLLADAALDSYVVQATDPLAEALAEGTRLKEQLLDEAGGALSSDVVARQLGVSRQAVDKRRTRGSLIAVPTASGDWAYPRAQFDDDGRPLAGLAEILRALRIDDPWARLNELLAPDPDLDGRSALALLREFGTGAVPRIARALSTVGEQGA